MTMIAYVMLLLVAASATLAGAEFRPLQSCMDRISSAPKESEGYNCLQRESARFGKTEDALAYLAALADPPPYAIGMMAVLQHRQGDPVAEVSFRRALARFEESPGPLEPAVTTRLAYARWLQSRGDHSGADRELSTAEEQARESQDSALLALVLVRQAAQWSLRMERLDEAEHQLRYVERELLNGDTGVLEAYVQTSLASVAFHTGRYALAIRRYIGVIDRIRDKLPLNALAMTYNAAVIANEAGEEIDEDLLRDLTERVRRGIPEAKALHLDVEAQLLLGILAALADDGEAIALLGACLEQGKLGDGLGYGQCAQQLAWRLPSGQTERALSLVDASLPAHTFLDGVFACQARAEVFAKNGELEQLAATARMVLEGLDILRASQLDDETRARVGAFQAPTYYRLSGQLLELSAGDPKAIDLALQVMERLREETTQETPSRAQPDVEVFMRRQPLLMKLAEQDLSLLLDRTLPTLSQLQAQLQADEALLAYQLPPASRRSRVGWLVVVTPTGARHHAIPIAGLRQAAEAWAGWLQAGETPPPISTRVLSERFRLGETLAELGPHVRRLLVVADGPLALLPVHALLDLNGAPLFEHRAVSILPSMQLLLRSRSTDQDSDHAHLPNDVVVLADPKIDETSLQRLMQVSEATAAGLPWARREGQQIERQLGSRTLAFYGEDASLSRLPQNPALVHFATHTIVDEHDPDKPRLLLARDPCSVAEPCDRPSTTEGQDLESLALENSIVVLAACSGARGELLPGSGVLSLARHFFRAGAAAVVASPQPLHDEASARWFDLFYRELVAHRSVSEAAASAHRSLATAERSSAKWMMVLGDGGATLRARDGDDGEHRIGLWALGLCAGLLFVAGVYCRRNRHIPARRR